MVSDVTFQTALNQQQNTSASSTQLATDFSQFLTLLTVQLQNQDPLSPMDTTEFTNQLVAFTGVEQQINTNQKLDSLVSLSLGSTFSSALGYVGKDISYISSEFTYDGTNPSKITYALNDNAFESKIRIYNEEGDIVYEADAQTSAGSSHEFVWDGKNNYGETLEAGTYEVKIDALTYEGDAVGSSVVVQGNVRGVETQNGSIYLLVGERAVSVGNVLNVSQPATTTTTTTTDSGDDDTATGT